MIGGFREYLGKEMYDICEVRTLTCDETNDIQAKTVPVLPLALARAAVLWDKTGVYLMGGYNKDPTGELVPQSACYRLDPLCRKWHKLNSMTFTRWRHTIFKIADEIVAVGGYSSTGSKAVTKSSEIYDIRADIWRKGKAYPLRLISMASCVVNGVGYVSGGGSPLSSASMSSNNEHPSAGNGDPNFAPVQDLIAFDSSKFKMVAKMRTTRMDHCMCAIDDVIYMIGGWKNMSVESYNVKTRQLTDLTNLPLPKYNTNALVYDSCIILALGRSTADKTVVYNTKTKSWTVTFVRLSRPYAQGHIALINL